jgi:hypothetical protein
MPLRVSKLRAIGERIDTQEVAERVPVAHADGRHQASMRLQ